MKTLAYFLVFQMTVGLTYAQSFRELLWNSVETCHSNLEDVDEDGSLDYDTLIDDARNGYLKIAGSWPTCGCGCESTAAAFRGNDNTYTTVVNTHFSCSWQHLISSNKELTRLFPIQEVEDSLFDRPESIQDTLAHLYWNVTPPQRGTDTHVKLTWIPFGMMKASHSLVTFSFSEEDGTFYFPYYQLKRWISNLKSESSLDQLVRSYWTEIHPDDLTSLELFMGKRSENGEKYTKLQKVIALLYLRYQVYQNLKYNELILSWNREKKVFELKSLLNTNQPDLTFVEFVQRTAFWGPLC